MAHFILKWRIPILVLVPTVFVVLQVISPAPTFDNSVESMLDPDDPALALLHEFRGIFGSEEDIFVGIEAEDVFAPAVLTIIQELSDQISEVDNVDEVISIATAREIVGTEEQLVVEPVMPQLPTSIVAAHALRDRVLANDLFHNQLVSHDGTVASMVVRIRVPEHEILDGVDFRAPLTDETRRIVAEVCDQPVIHECHIAGPPMVKMDLVRMSQKDHGWFLPVSAGLVVLVLLLVFRSLTAVFLSVVSVLLSLGITLSLVMISGRLMNMVMVILTPLILVIGLTAAIHLISRYGEALRAGQSKPDALRDAINHVGLASLLTSVTTAAGFLSLTVSPVIPIRDFGVFAAVGIMITLVVCMSMVPAALSLLPPPRISSAVVGRASWTGRLVGGAAHLITHRRRRIWIFSGFVAALAVAGIFQVEVETILIKFFHEDHPLRRAYMFVNDHLSGEAPVEILFQSDQEDRFKDPDVLRAVDRYRAWLTARDEPGKVIGLTDLVKNINRAVHAGSQAHHTIPPTREAVAQYLLLYESAASSNREPEIFTYVTEDYAVARLSARLHLASTSRLAAFYDDLIAFQKQHPIEGVRIGITGAAVLYARMVEKIVESQIKSFGLALIVIFLVMTVLFRSIKVGAVSMIPNLIPVSLAAGVMGWLGFNLTVSTAMIASVAIGIAVDDTIHFLVRFKHEHGKDRDYLHACRRTLMTTGRPVIFTSLVISAGFLILCISSFRPNLEFGVLTAVALLSAMIADLT
ncbi:RND family transporter, partial [Myxococcota bacterium]